MGVKIYRPDDRILTLTDSLRVFAARGGAALPWWYVPGKTCVAAYQPKGAASYAASLTDLSGSGNHATEGVAPTWNVGTGWTFDGIDDYLRTGWVPGNDQSQSLLIQFVAYSGTGFALGCGSGGNALFGARPSNHTGVVYRNGASLIVAPLLANGNLAVAGATAYRNGIAEPGSIGAWVGSTTDDLVIGALHLNNAATLWGALTVVAVSVYSDELSAAEVATVSAAMAAL